MLSVRAVPLPELLRPEVLPDFIGQEHLLGSGRPLRTAIEKNYLHSMIFWGPPGTGKTTLARILADHFKAEFYPLSAITAGVAAIKKIAEGAKNSTQKHLIFIDEIHRFSKSQQDVLLPFIESGTLVLIGATTENPAFSLNNALLSRVSLYPFKQLSESHLLGLIDRACAGSVEWEKEELKTNLVTLADGDARRLLNYLDVLLMQAEDNQSSKITESQLIDLAKHNTRYFDNKGDLYYETISALHKSVRGSNPNAAIYWCARMLEAGCDPRFVARRLIRMANEDIGNADINALTVAHNALKTFEVLGSPEGELAIEQAALYLACAPKSNAAYMASKKVRKVIENTGTLPVPIHLRNAPTKVHKQMDYGKKYRYAHDFPNSYVPNEQYLPDQLDGQVFYEPSSQGLEIKISEKLQRLKKLDELAK